MSVLSEIRALPEALRALTAAVQEVADLTRENRPAMDRLDDLERSRATWEAEAEGAFLKADSRYKAAAASEARARGMEKNAKTLADPFAEESEDVEEGVPPEYADVGEEEGMLDVPMALAPLNSKALAQRLKFS